MGDILKNPELLDRAVRVEVPPGLLQRLQRDISRCVQVDPCYSPLSDMAKHATGEALGRQGGSESAGRARPDEKGQERGRERERERGREGPQSSNLRPLCPPASFALQAWNSSCCWESGWLRSASRSGPRTTSASTATSRLLTCGCRWEGKRSRSGCAALAQALSSRGVLNSRPMDGKASLILAHLTLTLP